MLINEFCDDLTGFEFDTAEIFLAFVDFNPEPVRNNNNNDDEEGKEYLELKLLFLQKVG